MALLHLLLLLVPAALAAPTSGESGEDHVHTLKNLDSGESGEDHVHTLKNLDSGEDYIHMKNYDSSEEYEDFDNLTLSRAGFEERAINTCDCAPVSSSDRIVGGKEVNPKFKLPYQVLVSPCNSNGQCMMCGGTILNKRYVVTAAHCLFDGNTQLTVKGGAKFRVMVGEHDHCKHNEAGGKSYVLASVVHKHPKFSMDNPSGDNDIAILKLSKDLTFSDKIKPACLPTSATKDYSGKAASVSGWGGTKAYEPLTFVNQPRQCGLKEGIVNILKTTDKKCENFLGDSTTTTMLCAWAKGTDACQGDSGGPLTVAENGKYVLLGVVSYGSGCATQHPGIYARVQGFLPWIKTIIADGECAASG